MKRSLGLLTLAAALGAGAYAVSDGSTTRAAAPAEPATFSNQVVRIFQQNCQTCHHPGDIAPFSLMTYEEATPWAESIRANTQSKAMPPWKPVDGCGDFANKRGLSDADIATIAEWVEAGAPEGNPADLPESLVFDNGWKLGVPDVEFQTVRNGYRVPASATDDIYRCFTIPTNFDASRFITGVEVSPSNRKIVHHVILYIDTTGISVTLDQQDPGPGYTSFGGPGFPTVGTLGGWAPGAPPQVLRDGTGYLVPKGARIVAQVHYKPNGQDEADTTSIALQFARTPVYQDVIILPVINQGFTIPANARDYPVTASFTLPPHVNVKLEYISPHMHLLGREMQVTSQSLVTGERTCLVYIDNWDFHWQGSYKYRQPLAIPGATVVELTARYDNSELNHNQPTFPPVDVSWGEKTTDEMCIAFLGLTIDAEHREPSTPEVSSVRVLGSKLIVEGTEILPGSLIVIDGVVVRDTKVKSRQRALSKSAWTSMIPAGEAVTVRVLNPDGASSPDFAFQR